jgi:hypothetical protein
MPTDIERTSSHQARESQPRKIKHHHNARDERRLELIQRYLHLTRTVMPTLAQTTSNKWPVQNDHCFQRIVLDAVCAGVWYNHISRPAYQHLGLEQAHRAVEICEEIIAGTADLPDLNRQSLLWRGKL